MNEVELEVFRADEKASRGITSRDIADMVSVYDPEKAPAAICIGHPKSDTPAHGIINSFRAEGSRLFATVKDLGEKVVKGIKKGELINRSMAFFGKDHEANPFPGKLYPRHLGLLGASAPGIPGMSNIKKALAFSADDELEVDGDPAPALIFDARREPTPTFSMTEESTVADEPNAEQLKADRANLDRERQQFEAERETARKGSNKTLVDGLVSSGRVLPADAERLATIFNSLGAEPLEFEAGKEKRSAASELASIFAAGPELVDTSGKRLTPDGKPNKEFDAKTAKPGEIDAAARKLMAENKSLTFEAAVAVVTGQDADEE